MSLKYYQDKDNDIAVFLYILRNECDEEFRFSQGQIRKTLKELLKIFISEYHPYSQVSNIEKTMEKKLKNFITSKEATEIVNYLYCKEDSQEICSRFEHNWTYYVNEKNSQNTRQELYIYEDANKKKKIKYKDFEKIILDFSLMSHLQYLRGFTLLFREINKDQNGIINEKEFREQIHRMDPEGEYNLNIEQLLIHYIC